MTHEWRGLELYSPANLEHSKKVAEMLWQSGAYCRPWIKNPSTILVIMQRGASLGFDPLTSLDELFQFAQGGAWGIRIGAARAMCAKAGKWHYEVSTDDICVLTVKREGWEPHEETITREEATAAGIGKATLGRYPRQILRATAFRRAAQTVFADCLLGFVPIDTDTEGRDAPGEAEPCDRAGSGDTGNGVDGALSREAVDAEDPESGNEVPDGSSEFVPPADVCVSGPDTATARADEAVANAPGRRRGRPAGAKNRHKEAETVAAEVAKEPENVAGKGNAFEPDGIEDAPPAVEAQAVVVEKPKPALSVVPKSLGTSMPSLADLKSNVDNKSDKVLPTPRSGVRYSHGDRQHRMVLVEAVQKSGMTPDDLNYIRANWASFAQANVVNCDVTSIIEGFRRCLLKRVNS